MTLLFIIALLLAWPTYGLSVVAWIVLVVVKSKGRADRAIERGNRKILVEPLFDDRFSEFFRSLDMPILHSFHINDTDAHKCGRHIMNYLAHNPEEGALFLQGLKKWQTKGSYQLCDPVRAAESERIYDVKGEIHLVSYRAIEALMTNNKSLECFHPIDFGKLVQNRMTIEMESLSARR